MLEACTPWMFVLKQVVQQLTSLTHFWVLAVTCCAARDMQPSFASIPADKLPFTMKTLAVPDTGNLVVTGALPVITKGCLARSSGGSAGEAAQQGGTNKGHPEASTSWFNRMYLRESYCASGLTPQCGQVGGKEGADRKGLMPPWQAKEGTGPS